MLAGPYGHPAHPAIVPLPIGAWVCSFVLDLASRFDAAPPWLGDASRWLIAIGGRLAYRYGVRVAAEDVQSEGFHSTT